MGKLSKFEKAKYVIDSSPLCDDLLPFSSARILTFTALGSTIGKEFIDRASDYQFLKVLAPMELDGQSSAFLAYVAKRESRSKFGVFYVI
jgi:hypothetical protein